MNRTILLIQLLIATALLLLLSACSVQKPPVGAVEAGEELTAADFGVLAEEPEHNHDDHDHDEEGHDHSTGESEFDHGLTATGEEGVFLDHHGNRVVNELYQKFEHEELTLEFTVENFLGVGGRGGEESFEIVSGERAVVKFRVTDPITAEPISGLRPLAWLERSDAADHADVTAEEHQAVCDNRVEGYLSGALTARPTVDLNSFFILTLNEDPSVSVIDPTVDVAGMTQLFAVIQLAQPGADWAMSANQAHLWVTIPGTNQVAVAELDGFSVAQHLPAGTNPQHIAFQPDQRFLWIGNDAEGSNSGVTVIDPETRTTVAQISTGAGQHALAFAPDSSRAYVTNADDGSVSVIDTESLSVIATLEAGEKPLAAAVSPANASIYVADAATGTLTVFDDSSLEPRATIQTAPGLTALGLSPDGRWIIATNANTGTITVADASTNRVTHVAETGGAPDQVTFSETAVYIRDLNAPAMNVIQLSELDANGSLEMALVPVGQQPPGATASLASANAIHSADTQQALVVANPSDDQVYFFPEGATAASGSFQGHTLRPRAATVVDRSLQEEAPGVYAARLRIPDAGHYTVALMLTDPVFVHCFEFDARPSPKLAGDATPTAVLEVFNAGHLLTPGEPHTLQISITDSETGAGIDELGDVYMLANQLAGNWSTRHVATAIGDGIYEITLTVPSAGFYSVFFAIPSLGLNPDQLPNPNLQAVVQ